MSDLSRIVFVKGEGTARWDGVLHDLTEGVQVRLGVANFWQSINIKLTVTDVPEANIPPRDIVNPLQQEMLGEAFAGVKRRKKKEG